MGRLDPAAGLQIRVPDKQDDTQHNEMDQGLAQQVLDRGRHYGAGPIHRLRMHLLRDDILTACHFFSLL